MDALRPLARVGLALATLGVLSGCASSGQRPQSGAESSTAQAGNASASRSSSSVLTAAEIASVPGVTNAYDAVQSLRPSFLRARGGTSRPPTMVGAGAEGQPTGRRPGQVQGSQPAGSQGGRGEDSHGVGRPEDPGILVYIERQRYGGVQTLREIPIATIEEIRFLNVGEANSLFGMGHPHGVIQIIPKRGGSQ